MRAWLLIVLMVVSAYSVDAHSLMICSDADKIYVSPEQVMIDHEGIFVLSEGHRIQVAALMQDDVGLYHLTPSIYWVCKWCSTKNLVWKNYCTHCNRHYKTRPEKEEEE